MELTLAKHPVTQIDFGAQTRVDGTVLSIEREELRRLVLEDTGIADVEFAILSPGESARAGPIFDIVEPRAKEPGSGSDFPGILGPATTGGIGTTHVLTGAAVSIVAEMSPDTTRSPTGRVLEMSGAVTEASDYSSLQHLLIIPHTKPDMSRHAVVKAYRLASLKIAVHIARTALHETPASVHTFEPLAPPAQGREVLARVAYIGQIFSRQRKPGVDEPILYGTNTDGM
ncbi:MAG: glycine/sarcosine/betaine reductase component B subunit, partial [Candidatus Binatia bacterium]